MVIWASVKNGMGALVFGGRFLEKGHGFAGAATARTDGTAVSTTEPRDFSISNRALSSNFGSLTTITAVRRPGTVRDCPGIRIIAVVAVVKKAVPTLIIFGRFSGDSFQDAVSFRLAADSGDFSIANGVLAYHRRTTGSTARARIGTDSRTMVGGITVGNVRDDSRCSSCFPFNFFLCDFPVGVVIIGVVVVDVILFVLEKELGHGSRDTRFCVAAAATTLGRES